MFRNAISFNVDISGWDISSVRKMKFMFAAAASYKSNLCPWLHSPKFPNAFLTGSMFQSSGCDSQSDPSSLSVCHYCNEYSTSTGYSCVEDVSCVSAICENGHCVECRSSSDCNGNNIGCNSKYECVPWTAYDDRSNYVWTSWFSEEGHGYPNPNLMPGAFRSMRCGGGNCDNKQLKYKNVVMFLNTLGGFWSDWFSDETGESSCHHVHNQAYISRITCRGSNCDDMKLYCQYLDPELFKTDTSVPIYYTSWFSEEGSAIGSCPYGYFVMGMRCNGNLCDNIKLSCRKVISLV
jgi:surface protein